MINQFGKIVRKARLDTGETLSTMAKGVGKTVSFLSAIETGAKKIPLSLIPTIKEYLITKGANPEDLATLEHTAMLVNKEICLNEVPENQQELLVRFAKSELTQAQIDEINKIIGEY